MTSNPSFEVNVLDDAARVRKRCEMNRTTAWFCSHRDDRAQSFRVINFCRELAQPPAIVAHNLLFATRSTRCVRHL